MTDRREMTLIFNAPNRPLSMNERLHWAAARRRLQPWRTLTAVAYRSLRAESDTPVPVEITVTLPFARAGRRDPHNFAPVVKVIVDTLVQEGLVPDDTAEWVTVIDPILKHPSKEVQVKITQRRDK